MKVSIITPSFNQARFLPETLRSVRGQTHPHIEHIIVDGGSTDGSVDILRAAPSIRWVSESDRGQVDAINKGFSLATGEVLAWLNSDDTLDPDAVRLAVEALQRTGADMVYGDLRIIDAEGTHIRMFYGIPFDYRTLLYGINYIGQQSAFFRRALLGNAGPLRAEYDNGFDYELWLRMARYGRLVYVPQVRGQIRWHVDAKSVVRAQRTWTDTDRIRREYWRAGGLPAFLSRRPWAGVVNWYYRAKRIWRIRKASRTRATTAHSGVGLFAAADLRPGHHAINPCYGRPFPERFDVTFMNLNVVRDYRELEVFHWRKLAAVGAPDCARMYGTWRASSSTLCSTRSRSTATLFSRIHCSWRSPGRFGVPVVSVRPRQQSAGVPR